jgi:hypothetical protein
MEEDRSHGEEQKVMSVRNASMPRALQINAEGCGRLFQKSFRDRYLRGHCDTGKIV